MNKNKGAANEVSYAKCVFRLCKCISELSAECNEISDRRTLSKLMLDIPSTIKSMDQDFLARLENTLSSYTPNTERERLLIELKGMHKHFSPSKPTYPPLNIGQSPQQIARGLTTKVDELFRRGKIDIGQRYCLKDFSNGLPFSVIVRKKPSKSPRASRSHFVVKWYFYDGKRISASRIPAKIESLISNTSQR